MSLKNFFSRISVCSVAKFLYLCKRSNLQSCKQQYCQLRFSRALLIRMEVTRSISVSAKQYLLFPSSVEWLRKRQDEIQARSTHYWHPHGVLDPFGEYPRSLSFEDLEGNPISRLCQRVQHFVGVEFDEQYNRPGTGHACLAHPIP